MDQYVERKVEHEKEVKVSEEEEPLITNITVVDAKNRIEDLKKTLEKQKYLLEADNKPSAHDD